jgi:hypothetical protein
MMKKVHDKEKMEQFVDWMCDKICEQYGSCDDKIGEIDTTLYFIYKELVRIRYILDGGVTK